MRLVTYACVIILIFSLGLVAKPSLAASVDISLTIRNGTTVSRHHTAITSGVPLPRSANITDEQQLQVIDNTGKIVPTQLTVLSRWGGEVKDTSKPIKWVLLDLVAKKVRSKTSVQYHLQTGANDKVPAQAVKIKRHNDKHTLTVRTGAATFVLNTKNFNLFQQVYLEPNHQALLADGKQVGGIATAKQTEYKDNNGAIQTFKVEQRGPVHSIVLVKGWNTSSSGERLLAYTARLHFYAGQAYVKVQYGVWNDNVMLNVNGQPDIKALGSPHTVLFSDLTLSTQLAQHGEWSYVIGGTNKNYWSGSLTDQATLYQDSSGGSAWHDDFGSKDTTFRGFRAVADTHTWHDACSDIEANKECRALGWLDLSSSRGGLAVGVRDFWQNFPKNLVAQADGTIAVKLFPDEYSSDFELRVGERKTHEVFYYFHDPANNAKQVAHTMFDLHHPLIATASAQWYLASGAFQDSVPYDAQNFSAYEGYNDAAIMYKEANLFLLEDGIPGTSWLYGNRPESLGWRNWGDRIAEDETSPDNYPVFANQQYDDPWFFTYQFIRTLDTGAKRSKLWWQLIQPAVWHQSDVDIVHSRCTGKSEVYMVEHCMDPANPYAIGWAMGGRLTNQWHAWAVPDTHRNALIDSWSGGLRGMLYYWYLTGDPVAKDGWQELMKHAYWEVNNSPCNADPSLSCGPGYASLNPKLGGDWTRDSAYSIEMLTDAGLVTGQDKYFTAAHDSILKMDPTGVWFADENFKLDSTAAQTGQTIAPWTLAMVLKSLGYYVDAYRERYGTIDTEAQKILMDYATISSRLWQLGATVPSQYYIYETGGYVPEDSNPMDVALADGLAAALKYDNGQLNRTRIAAVADEAFVRGSRPWGEGYAVNTFTTAKTHVMMGINGWYYLRYKLTQ